MPIHPRPQPRQSVVIVNGGPDVVDVLDGLVGPGAYDVTFVHLGARAHGRIKTIAPNLIVLCTRLEEPSGFQLLTMLKLDADTRDIPVLTLATDQEGQDDFAAAMQWAEEELGYPAVRPALRMN